MNKIRAEMTRQSVQLGQSAAEVIQGKDTQSKLEEELAD